MLDRQRSKPPLAISRRKCEHLIEELA